MHIVLLGPPGAGKGTQATRLAGALGLVHVASGDLFRRHQAEGSELGMLVKTYLERGQLVPDEVTTRMVIGRLDAPDAAGGHILDGFPRTLAQAATLDKSLAQKGQAVDRALLVQVDIEEMVRRLEERWVCSQCQAPYSLTGDPVGPTGRCPRCGGKLVQRPDDRPEVVRRRIRAYEEETEPLVEYYRRQSKLRNVNGQQSVERVTEELLRAIEA